MPTPNQGESREDFVQRCIPAVIEDGAAQDGEQAAAICHSMFEESKSKKMKKEKKNKTCLLELKDLNDDKGVVEFYFAAWGVDLDNDQILPIAYTKTLKENKSRVYHNRDHVEAVGTPMAFGTDENGAWVASKLAIKTMNGRDMFEQYRAGLVKGHSQEFETIIADVNSEGVRQIKELRLWGVTSVTKIPANLDTPTISLKSYADVAAQIAKINNILKSGNISDELGESLVKQFNELCDHMKRLKAVSQEDPALHDGDGWSKPTPTINYDFIVNNL